VSAPNKATSGEAFNVYLRISPKSLAELLTSVRADYPENETVKGKDGVKLVPRMTASVSGDGFEVSPKEDQAQAVSSTEQTTWQWQVKPTESGPLSLTFKLTGSLSVQGKDLPRNYYAYTQKVDVAVNPGGFIERNWQWLATTLAIPGIGGLWALITKKQNGQSSKKSKAPAPPRKKRRG